MKRQKKKKPRKGIWIIHLTGRGSFTVEAVFLFPMIVFLIAFILQLSISWYQSAYTASQDVETVRELDTQEYFKKAAGLRGIKELLLP